MTTVAELVDYARTQIGVQENPAQSNHVPYWDWIGRPDLQGNPWCAAFVTYCFMHMGVPLTTVDTYHGFVYCPDEETFARNHGELTVDPQPGDIVLYTWHNSPTNPDHTGIFVRWENSGHTTLRAIEGNTGLSNGNDGVSEEIRPASLVACYCRPDYTGPKPTAPQNVPIAAPAAPPQAVSEHPGDHMRIVTARSLPLDGNGDGYTDIVGYDKTKCVGVLVNGADPHGVGYPGYPIAVAALAVPGATRVIWERGAPKFPPFDFTVTFAD